MLDEHYFADVTLPNHVWVRERAGSRSRWVLRNAAELQGQLRSRGAAERLGATSGGSGEGSCSPRS
jgi:hypothetical protein